MWYEMAKCNHCDEIICEYKFSSSFFYPVCPKCGGKNNFRKVTAKYAFKGSILKPWTWLKFGWVER